MLLLSKQDIKSIFTMQDAIEKARDIITSGAAKKQLEKFVEKSNA